MSIKLIAFIILILASCKGGNADVALSNATTVTKAK